jgi:hypothetical protein
MSVSNAEATTERYGLTMLSSSVSNTSTSLAATPSAVKQAYDKANAALPKAGGTMTGDLTLKGNPTSNLHAATKQYVDNAVKNLDVQADWSQKNETSKSFIKNRTHWEYYEPAVPILNETTFTTGRGMPPGSYTYIDGSFLRNVDYNVEYEIAIDGIVYNKYLQYESGVGEYFGNLALFNSSYTDTGEDFLIHDSSA